MARSIIALAVFIVVFFEKGAACDVCGFSVGGGLGLMPAYHQNFVGFQYQHSSFSSTLEHGDGSSDDFHAFEFVARYRVFRRLNLQLNQPWRLNIRRQHDGDQSQKGFGDTRLTGNLILLNQVRLGKKFSLYAEAGSGVKMPTGKYEPDLRAQRNLPENFNTGNGNWAWLLQSSVVLNLRNRGLMLTGSHQRNRRSTDGYRFGNQWSGQVLLFNQFNPDGRFSLTPFGGVSAEKTGSDETPNGKFAPSTGGNGWFVAAGANLKFDDWLVGMAYLQPFSQHYSNAEVEAKGRLTAQLTYIF
jgi:hypothetical protein